MFVSGLGNEPFEDFLENLASAQRGRHRSAESWSKRPNSEAEKLYEQVGNLMIDFRPSVQAPSDHYRTYENPVGSVFLTLAHKLPDVQFAAVPTWGTTRQDQSALGNKKVLERVIELPLEKRALCAPIE